jgi:hypothetical protein
MNTDRIQITDKERHARYYQQNKKRLDKYLQEWAINNPDKMKSYRSTPEAKEAQRQRKRKWDRKRAADPVFRIDNNMRGNMYHALKAKKGFRKWETLVGYTLEDLIKHLTPQLNGVMTWDNYGTEWHVDHIIPKSWFKYDSAEHPLFRECWALKNLQPKLKADNMRKGNRFIG